MILQSIIGPFNCSSVSKTCFVVVCGSLFLCELFLDQQSFINIKEIKLKSHQNVNFIITHYIFFFNTYDKYSFPNMKYVQIICFVVFQVVADEAWTNHRRRDNSFLADLYQGQYKSTLVCPACEKVKNMFSNSCLNVFVTYRCVVMMFMIHCFNRSICV